MAGELKKKPDPRLRYWSNRLEWLQQMFSKEKTHPTGFDWQANILEAEAKVRILKKDKGSKEHT